MKKLIIGDKIVKSFEMNGKKQVVLNQVSVYIEQGEYVSVMGPSGSGKSTLLYALSGMDDIENGQILFDGKELLKMKEKALADLRRTQMGFVFQQPHLLKNLNLIDNIILPSMNHQKQTRETLVKKARALMKETGIEALEGRGTSEVSGGQLQRAGICRALMNHPKIIFGDEPTGALNSRASQEVMDLFSKINKKGTTIMLVTHDAKVAAQSERIMFMKDGKIVDELYLKKYEGIGIEERIKKVMESMQLLNI